MDHNESPGLQAVIQQFNTLRDEVHLRVRQHTQLVLFKIITLGAVTSFFVEKTTLLTPPDATPRHPIGFYLWLVPLMGAAMDALIAGNLRALYNIGPYIKSHIEPLFRRSVNDAMIFWEEAVATNTSKTACYTRTDIVFIGMFTVAPLLVVAVVRLSGGFRPIDAAALVMNVGLSGWSIALMLRAVTAKR